MTAFDQVFHSLDNAANADAEATSSGANFRCGQCGRRFSREESPVLPFCSVRCQQIDLGRWLDEDIGVPIEESEPGFDEEQTR